MTEKHTKYVIIDTWLIKTRIPVIVEELGPGRTMMWGQERSAGTTRERQGGVGHTATDGFVVSHQKELS